MYLELPSYCAPIPSITFSSRLAAGSRLTFLLRSASSARCASASTRRALHAPAESLSRKAIVGSSRSRASASAYCPSSMAVRCLPASIASESVE